MDQFDKAGLQPNSAPWMLPPDAGIEAPDAFNISGWNPPTHGGDVTSTTQRPSQEPRQVAEWPRDDAQLISQSFNENPVAGGNDMRRSTPAEGTAQADGYDGYVGSTSRYTDNPPTKG